jgi:hypothetical protein
MAATPQHVLASAFGSHLIDFDAAAAAAACKLPIAYIGAEVPMANLSKFREFCPHLKVGQTLGCGHFSTLLVPEQVKFGGGAKEIICSTGHCRCQETYHQAHQQIDIFRRFQTPVGDGEASSMSEVGGRAEVARQGDEFRCCRVGPGNFTPSPSQNRT